MISFDLTQLHERLESVADPVGFLISLFSYTPVGFAIWKPDGHCLLTNKAFRDLFGSEPPSDYNILKDEIAAERGVLSFIQLAFAGETTRLPTFWYDARDLEQVTVTEGNRVAISMTVFPVLNRKGEIEYVAAIYKDETEITLAHEQLEAEGEQLRALVRQLEQEIAERKRVEALAAASEHRFRALIEHSVMPLNLVNSDGIFTYVSPSATRVVGFMPDEMIGQPAINFVHPDEILNKERPFEWLLAHPGITMAVERRVLHKDGSWRWVDGFSTNLLNDPAVNAIVFNYRDITDRKQAEDALHKSEEHFRALIQNAADVVQLVNEAGLIVYVSPSVTRVLGYTPEEMLGRYVPEILHPDELESLQDSFTKTLQEPGAIARVEQRIRHQDGSWRWVEVTATNLIHDPAVGAIVINYHDITERKQSQEEILQLNEALEERVRGRTAELETANKELESFSYSVSHDLRAPLRAIDGFSRILTEDNAEQLDAEGKKHLSRIHEASQRMAQLIDDLLGLSRTTRRVMTLGQVNLSSIAESISEELRILQPEREVEFLIAPGLTVNADRNLIRIVLENLLNNAWKYTSKQPHARIEFATQEQDGQPVYFVRDDGVGFDMAYAEKLFIPFQRLHGRSEFEGTGIGLATVHRIIARHGGKVWTDAAPQQGATFYFTLNSG